MTTNEYIGKAKKAVVDYFNGQAKTQITQDDIFVVWYCKTLQHHKALLSTTVPDGMYYELTYNGDKGVCYFDAYKKWNKSVLHW